VPDPAAVEPNPGPERKGERLQVVLARHGIASRRGVVGIIEGGAVEVNGVVVREKGFRVDAATDKIRVEGRELAADVGRRKRTFMLHKPAGVMTTMQDPHTPKTVADFFKDVPERLFPVGRLDRDTTGLLLMTNDGELAFRLTHPKFGVKKRYHVVVGGHVPDPQLQKLRRGVELEDGPTAPCEIRIEDRTPTHTAMTVVLHEGRKRQIRRLFDHVGHGVRELSRQAYGPLTLGDLREGQRRELRPDEVAALFEATKPKGKKLAAPYAKPPGKPFGKPQGGAGNKHYRRPSGQPFEKPRGDFGKKPYGGPRGKPYGRPEGRSFGRPEGQSSGGPKPFGRPDGKPTGPREGKPFGGPPGKPYGKRPGKPFGRPGGKRFGRPHRGGPAEGSSRG
jgi:pseudouridine synthase